MRFRGAVFAPAARGCCAGRSKVRGLRASILVLYFNCVQSQLLCVFFIRKGALAIPALRVRVLFARCRHLLFCLFVTSEVLKVVPVPVMIFLSREARNVSRYVCDNFVHYRLNGYRFQARRLCGG